MWTRRVICIVACALLFAALGSVARGADAQTSARERVEQLYTNSEAIESLREDILPAGWEDAVELDFTGMRYKSYRCENGGLEWELTFEKGENGTFGPFSQADFQLRRTSLDERAQPQLHSLSMTLGERLGDGAASFYCLSDDAYWGISIPPERCKAALTEFALLANACAKPANELTDVERTERSDTIDGFLRRWRAAYPFLYEYLSDAEGNPCVEADYGEGQYTLRAKGDHETLAYALTRAQFDAAYADCAALPLEQRAAYATGYAQTLNHSPQHVLLLYDEAHDYLLSARYDGSDEFFLSFFLDGEEDGEFVRLDQQQYEALAAQLLPLDPAERSAPMRAAYLQRQSEK